MKTKMKKTFFMIALMLILTITSVFALESFSVTPSTVSSTDNVNIAKTGTLTVTNTGDEVLNLTISKTNTQITINTNVTTITNLGASQSAQVSYSYNTGSSLGTFNEVVTFRNTNNASHTQTVSYTITVNAIGSPSIDLDGVSGTVIDFIGDIDRDDLIRNQEGTFRIENTGDVELTNIEINIRTLDGDDTNDELDEGDFEINRDDVSDFTIESLGVGEFSESIDLRLDIPNVDADIYEGIMTITSDEGLDEDYTIRVVLTGDQEIEILQNSRDVRLGVLRVIAEEGRLEKYEFEVENTGDVDANDLIFAVDGDLQEKFTNNVIPKEAISFSPSIIDLDDGDDDIIEVRINVPAGQPSGTYITEILILDASGDEIQEESITLEVKIIGDIFIKELIFDDTIEPGNILDVEVIVRNQGSSTVRNIQIKGILENVDFGNSDITKTSSSFLLDINEEITQILRFNIPKDALDGPQTLEIRVEYDNEQIIEISQIEIVRPLDNIVIDSSSISSSVVQCQDELYTYIKYRNLGSNDKIITVSSEIIDTNIKKSSNSYELVKNQIDQQNFILDISSLKEGTYTVSQRINFGGKFVKQDSTLTVLKCNEGGVGGIDIKPINETTQNETTDNKVQLFGTEFEKATVYLGTGLGLIVILIVIGLFLL